MSSTGSTVPFVEPTQAPAAIPTPEQTGQPAEIAELKLPDFWPDGLDPMDNQRVSLWLLGGGEWEGQEPGWKRYALDPETAAMKPGTWAWRNKRVMDLSLTLLGLPFALPIMGFAALALKISSPKEPVLFKQWRPGYLCKPFQILKFRTMRTDGDSESPREDGQRLTRLGRFLRNTSIDELPQLFNVLKGEMSLVGPRPQLMTYLPRCTQAERQRHSGLLGITGLAQVEGRNLHTWGERFALDIYFFQTRTLASDFIILYKTGLVVFFGKGVRAPGHDTNQEFVVSNIK
ncbi:MAG: sugar transferase [Planctomycetota bacterium]|nr:sugar transferase [Planctomycetota bacterium]